MSIKKIRSEYKQKKRLNKNDFKKIKKDYRNQQKDLKNDYKNNLEIYFESDEFKSKSNPPRRPILEEIGNAITHGTGSVFAVIAFAFMLIKSDAVNEFISASVYFFGLFTMFTMSCLYHSFEYGRKVKRIFRRFDYLSIYLLIGATYTPILLCFMGGVYGIVFCIVQWLLIAIGITFISVFGPTKFRWIHFPLYLILGWSALIFIPKMISENFIFFMWVLSGGIAYTFGILPFAINKKAAHFIWHFFVLAGAIIQWIGIYKYVFCV